MAICHVLITFTHLADITYTLLSKATYCAFKCFSLPVYALPGLWTCDAATQHALVNEERLLVLWLFLVNKHAHRWPITVHQPWAQAGEEQSPSPSHTWADRRGAL